MGPRPFFFFFFSLFYFFFWKLSSPILVYSLLGFILNIQSLFWNNIISDQTQKSNFLLTQRPFLCSHVCLSVSLLFRSHRDSMIIRKSLPSEPESKFHLVFVLSWQAVRIVNTSLRNWRIECYKHILFFFLLELKILCF